MSICCNPNASNKVFCEVMEKLLASDSNIMNLQQWFKALQTKLKQEYQFIKQALMKRWKEHQDLCRQLTNVKKSLKINMKDTKCKNYFFQIHNIMMKKQLWRPLNKTVIRADTENSEDSETIIKHQLKEWTQLQQVFCNLFKNLSPHIIVTWKVFVINHMVMLASWQEFQTCKSWCKLQSAPTFKNLIKRESFTSDLPLPHKSPVVCKKIQCIFCIRNQWLSYLKQTCTFSCVAHMWNHVENLHLWLILVEQQIICPHSDCDRLILNNMICFKNHVVRTHEIKLQSWEFCFLCWFFSSGDLFSQVHGYWNQLNLDSAWTAFMMFDFVGSFRYMRWWKYSAISLLIM